MRWGTEKRTVEVLELKDLWVLLLCVSPSPMASQPQRLESWIGPVLTAHQPGQCWGSSGTHKCFLIGANALTLPCAGAGKGR